MAENNEFVSGDTRLLDKSAKYDKFLLLSKCLGFF